MPGAAATLQGARVADLEQAYLRAKSAYSLAGGKSADHSVYTELKAAKKDALARLKAARSELADAHALADRFPGSRLASTDLEKALVAVERDVSKLKIVKAAPLVDVAATAYNVYDDVHNRGWSVPYAVIAESAATLAGVGAAVGYEATEAVTALTHDGHWGDNIHKYGVVGGIGHSFADAGDAFVKDNVETAKKAGHAVAHAATSVWHGVFG